jgi:hypothetical protein
MSDAEQCFHSHLESEDDTDPFSRCVRCGKRFTPAQVIALMDAMCARKDSAYEERDRVVAAFARLAEAVGWSVSQAPHQGPDWGPEWKNVVLICTPAGQVSWHYPESRRDLFAWLPQGKLSWDGHETTEKYRRLGALVARMDDYDESIAPRWLGPALDALERWAVERWIPDADHVDEFVAHCGEIMLTAGKTRFVAMGAAERETAKRALQYLKTLVELPCDADHAATREHAERLLGSETARRILG